MKTINNNDQWLETLGERLSTVREEPETDMLDSILALAAASRRRRKAVIISMTSLIAASAAALALFLIPSWTETAGQLPSEAVAEVVRSVEAVGPAMVEPAAVGPAVFRSVASKAAPAVEVTVAVEPASPDEAAPSAAPTMSVVAERQHQNSPDQVNGPSAWDPSVWSELTASEDGALRRQARRLRLSIGSNAQFAEGMKGNPFALAVSSVKGDMDYRKRQAHISAAPQTRSSYVDAAFEQQAREEYQHWFTNSFPISLNIALSYNLTDHLALESGVSYTLLTLSKSARSYTTGDSYEDRYNIDFIGIPLSARYAFDTWRRTDFYVRAGGMVELITSTGALTPQFSSNTRINAGRTPFYSLSAGAGVQYNFNQVTGLYLEPGVSYHFSNDMIFATPYATTPMAFDLHAGLRVNLN